MLQPSVNGTAVAVRRRRGNADNPESYGDYCLDEYADSLPQVTILIQEGEDPNDQDSLLIFCKQYDLDGDKLSYQGHLCIDKASRCLELFLKLADEMDFPEGTEFSVFLESGDYTLQEIKQFCSLEQV